MMQSFFAVKDVKTFSWEQVRQGLSVETAPNVRVVLATGNEAS